mmetsp:Transcript_29241/g.70536  ORF Transcript_29241/g.70536 Transcript_29241/m.70536 type:complete len:213 (+) Transcript_29241:1168-1806(+)
MRRPRSPRNGPLRKTRPKGEKVTSSFRRSLSRSWTGPASLGWHCSPIRRIRCRTNPPRSTLRVYVDCFGRTRKRSPPQKVRRRQIPKGACNGRAPARRSIISRGSCSRAHVSPGERRADPLLTGIPRATPCPTPTSNSACCSARGSWATERSTGCTCPTPATSVDVSVGGENDSTIVLPTCAPSSRASGRCIFRYPTNCVRSRTRTIPTRTS